MIWRGPWTSRIRVASGLVLFIYVTLHFLNIGVSLISADLAEVMQNAKGAVIRSVPGTVILYGSLLAHLGLSLWRLARRGTLRMPMAEAVQTVFGLCIPFVLSAHIVYTRASHEIFEVNDDIGYIAALIWDTGDGWFQAALILLVWVHGCIGLHYWLRVTRWWRPALPTLTGIAVFIPAFALAGFMVEGRRMKETFADEELALDAMDRFNFPGPSEFADLAVFESWSLRGVTAVLAVAIAVFVIRRLLQQLQAVEIRYVNGPTISTPKGPTLLEMSRASGVPHTALCGGRGRCTTCRVMVDLGAEDLHPPTAAEQASLSAVNAPPGARLACQIRPSAPLTVQRVFRPDGRQDRAHASQGQERQLAILFLDMRGFTARTTGQLPYDIVFLLNRFFDAIVPAITAAGGTVDKYLGDGLLAVFETSDATSSARAALRAAQGIGDALERFNAKLVAEGSPAVSVGIGVHQGDIVLGEIGARGLAPRTIIGDAVNAASRLEGQTKALGVEALISKDVTDQAGISGDTLSFEALDLRGVSEPVQAWPVKRLVEIGAFLP